MLDGDRLEAQDTAIGSAVTSPTTSGVATTSPEPPPVPVVGERLRTARLDAGMTLEQVSAATRIRVPVLRELEDDQLGPAGSAVYTRGHIRAIAAAVGTDAAPLVQAFDAHVGAAAPSAVVVPETVPAPRAPSNGLSVPVPAAPDRAQPRWLTAALVGLVVLVSLLAIGTLTGGSDDREPDRATRRPDPVATALPPQAAQQPAPAAKASLVLTATGRSWLSVSNRGHYRLFEGPVEAGWTRRFDDPVNLTVRIGNAAAVRVACGSAPAGTQGGDGVALTLRCTPQGVQRP